jgi:nucleoid-associated protein YgaU
MLDAVKPAVDIQPDNSTDTLPDVAPIRTETPGPDQTGTPIMADAQPMQPPAQPQPTETPLQPTQVVTPAAVAPTTHPAVVANTGARTHVVAAGETFSSIAQSVYGASKYWNRIADANPNINPKSLHPGMILIIPGFSAPVEPAPSAPVAAAPAPIDPKTEYRVQPGDSLYKIAVHIYTNGNYAQKIYDLNKALIGADPAKLKVGQVLKLPAAPAPAAAAPAASH